MAERESWIERQQRLVRCKTHGLHFDPKMTSGCALCRKQAEPKRRSPQLAILLLILMGIVFIVMQLLTPLLETESVAADFEQDSGLELRQPTRSGGLDPEPYREQIEAVEAALFDAESEAFDEIGAAAATRALGLSQALRRSGTTLGARGADAVSDLAAPWQQQPMSFEGLQDARLRWMQLRDRLFRGAPWFSYGGAAGDTGGDRAAILAFRDLAGQAGVLIDEALSRVGAEVVSPLPNLPEPEDVREERLARERAWAADWRQRVEALAGRLPAPPPASASAELLAAVQGLRRALEQLRSIASEPGLVESESAASRLEDVAAEVRSAESGFDELLGA